MQFHYYETDYCISYKSEIIVMLITCVKQHSKNKLNVVFHHLECVIENYIKLYQREKMPKHLISLKFHEKCLSFCLCVIPYGKNPYYLPGSQIVSDPKIRNCFYYLSSVSNQFSPDLCSLSFSMFLHILQMTNRMIEVRIAAPLILFRLGVR